eukprot:4340772-Pyramimonas_sp.AAC.1
MGASLAASWALPPGLYRGLASLSSAPWFGYCAGRLKASSAWSLTVRTWWVIFGGGLVGAGAPNA